MSAVPGNPLSRPLRSPGSPLQTGSLLNRSISLVLSFLLSTAFISLPTLVSPPAAMATPNVGMTVSAASPLLGGQVGYDIVVTNNGDTKAYDLSIAGTFGSIPATNGASVSYVSASDNLSPTTRSATGVSFVNIRDLAPGESYTLHLVMKLSATNWSVGDTVTGVFTSTSLDLPANVPGANTQTNTVNKNVNVIPIALVSKTAHQSTGVEQATGTRDRTYTYTVDVQNNYTDPTANVIITDTIDDGIQYQGMVSGSAPTTVTRDPVTGKTVLVWNLGTVAAGQHTVLTYATGIRYDFYGTANGGLNTSDTAAIPTTLTTPIPNKTSLGNTADLTGSYTDPRTLRVTPVSTSDRASVSAAYFTGNKGQTVHGGGGPGSEVDYALTYYTSQYYAVAATASVLVTDTLPDGLTYKPGSSVPAPLSVTHHPDGTTDIVWVRPPIEASSSAGIAFTASVDTTYEAPALADQPVRSGDSFTNRAVYDTVWDDLVNTGRPNNRTVTTASSASASFSEPLPSVLKQVWDPKASSWSKATTVSVGDVMHYRVSFNTNGNRTPLLTTVPMGSIDLTDWLPMGTSLVPGSIVTTFSPGAFSAVGSRTPDPSVPTTLSAGGISGEEWWLGDVAQAGWWQAEFDVLVTSDPKVTGGVHTNNMWKMTGTNSYGKNYSDRDLVDVTYGEPLLTVTKTPQSPLGAPGVGMPYTVTLDNAAGTSAARGLKLTDQLPAGMRATAPTLDSVVSFDASTASTTAVSVSRFDTAYDAGLGAWTVTPKAGESIAVPAGGRLTFGLTATPDTTAGAGTVLPNTVTAAYATVDDTATARAYTPVTANATISLPGLSTLSKAGAPAALTLGDIATYTVTVSVPAGQVAWWPRIVDDLAIGGADYVAGSASLAPVSGTPVTPAAFNVGSTPTTSSPTNTSSRFIWQLANPVDNRGQATDYVFALTFAVRVTGTDHVGAREFWPMPANKNVAFVNTARTDWNSVAVAGPGTPDFSTANRTATINAQQPWVTVTKTVTNGAAFGGNSPVNFTVVGTNAGSWPARKLAFTDYLPIGMRNTTPTISAVRLGGSVLAPANYTVQAYDSGTGQISIDFAPSVSLAVNATLGVDVVATTDVSPLAGSSFVNTASIGFNTQSDGSGRDYPRTASVAANTGTASVAITSPTTVKSILSSTTAGIGDVVTYRLRVTVPAYTRVQNPTVVDTVQNTGMAMVAGSASLTDVSGSPTVRAALNPLTQVNTVGLATTFSMDSLVADRVIDNALSATPYVFDVTYTMNVTGLNGATWVWFAKGSTATSNNKIAFTWLANTGVKTTNGANIPLTVKWPNLTVTKSSNVPTASAGQTVTYTVTVRNDGTFPAYAAASGPSMVDTLPAGIDPATVVLGSVQRSWPSTNTLASGTDYTWAMVGSQLQVTYTQPGTTSTVVPVGGTLTFKYAGALKPDVGAGAQLTNTAAAFWSSEPTAAPYARTYNGTNANQPVGWKSSVTVGVPNTALLKSFTSSGVTTYTIGQQVPYTIVAAIPLNTTAYNAVMTDFVPKGLTVTTASVSPSGLGTLTVGAKSGTDGRTPITWTAGTVQNPTTALLTLTVTSTVDTTYFPSGGNVTAGQSIVNTAAVAWKDQASGGTTVTTVSNSLPLTVVEPQLTISKSLTTPITPGKAWAGQAVTYTVDVTNATLNASPAYGLVLHDLLPANLFRPADGSPALVSVTLNGVPLSSPNDYLADLSANPVSLDLATPLLGAAIPAGGTLRLTYVTTLPPAPATTDGAVWTNTATANSWSGLRGGGKAYGPASKTATLTTQAPKLTVVKSVLGDTYLQWGRIASYQAVVHNGGTAPAGAFAMVDTLSSLFMSEPIPGTPQAVWPTGSASPATVLNPLDNTVTWGTIPATLQPGQDLTLTWSQTVLGTAPLGSQDDTVAVSAVDPAGGPIAAAPAHIAITVTDPRLQVFKILHAGQNANVPLGATVTYDLGVLNTGNTTLSTVPLRDTFDSTRLTFVSASTAPDSQLPLGTLTWNNRAGAGIAPGARAATVTVTFRATATGTSVPDTATVGGALDNHGSPVATSTATESSLRATRPAVTLSKVLQGPALVPVGSSVTYVLSLLNSGDTTLTTLPLVDTFDSTRLTYSSATLTPNSTIPNGRLTWNNALTAPLAPGAVTTIGVTLSSDAVGASLNNTITCAAGTDEFAGTVPTTTTVNSVLSIGRPTLATLTKTASVATATAGQVVTYTVTTTNTGTTPAYDVFLTDTLPAAFFAAGSNPQLVAVKVDGTTVPGTAYSWSNGGNPVTLDLSGGTATAIPAGSTLTYTYLVTVPAGVGNSLNQTNTASVPSYGSLPTGGLYWAGPSGTATVRTLAPVLTQTKSVVGDVWLQAGGTASYRLVIHNGGGAAAAGILIRDRLTSNYMGAPINVQATWPGGSATLSASVNPVTRIADFDVVPGVLYPGEDLTLTWDMTLLTWAPTGSQDDTATTTGTDPLGGVVTAPPSHAAITVTDPHVAVTKVLHAGQPVFVPLGSTVTYDFSVRNTGDTTLTAVPLSDTYDASRLAYVSGTPDTTSVGLLTWNNLAGAGLAPGAKTATYTATFRATATGLSIADTATVAGARDIHADTAATAIATAAVSLTNPGASITKTLLSATPAPVGSQATYRLSMRNTGDTTLTVLPLSDAFASAYLTFATATVAPDSSTATSVAWVNALSAHGPLAAGATASIDISFYTGAIGDAVLNRSALATGTDVNGTAVGATSTANSVLSIGRPVLTVTKAASVATAQAGDSVTYTVSVANIGATPAYDLILSDAIPADLFAAGGSPVLTGVTLDGTPVGSGFTFVNASDPVSLTAADSLPIPAGSTLAATYRVTVPAGIAAGRTETNTVTASSYRSLPGGGASFSGPSASAAVRTLAPVLSVSKALTSSPWLQRNGTATYRVTVRNTGTAAATDFDLLDVLSSGYLSVPLFAGITATWPGGSEGLTAALDTVTHRVTFSTAHATLQPGESLVLTWSQTVAFDAPTGSQDDSVTVTGHDAAGGPVSAGPAVATFTVTDPHVAVAKVLHPGQASYVPLGGTVTYDIAVTNTGDTTLTHIPLTDTYDASRLQFVSGTADDWSVPGTLTWNELAGAGLAPGAKTATITVGFRAVATGTDVPNTVTVSGARDLHGDAAAPATATENSVTLTNPHVRIAKVLRGDTLVPLGSLVTYTVTVTNDGDTVLTSLPLSDTYDAGALRFVSATSTPDATGTGTLSWNNLLSGGLAPGDSVSRDVTFKAIALGTGVVNHAAVSEGTDANGSGVPTAQIDDSTLSIGRPDLGITKSTEATSAEAGQPVTYTVTVHNAGTTPAYDVLLTDLLPPDMALAGPIAVALDGTDLLPTQYALDISASPIVLRTDGPGAVPIPTGGTLTLVYAATLNGGVAPGISETNTATVASYASLPAGAGVSWGGPSAAANIVSRAPVLVVTKSVTGRSVIQPGDSTTFRMTVTNTGDAPARTIAFGDFLSSPWMSPLGMATLTMPGGGTSPIAPIEAGPGFYIWWSTETLSPGATATLDWTMSANSLTTASTQLDSGIAGGFDGTGMETDSNYSGASIQVTIPHLKVTKALVGPALVPLASTVSYDITVTNDGSTAVPSVPVTDTYDTARLAPTTQSPSANRSGGGTLAWNDITGGEGLLPGGSVTVRASFATLATGAAVTDTATVAGLSDADGSPIPSSEATNDELTIGRPQLTIAKAANVATAVAGQVVTYTITITNTGTTPAYHTRLNDQFDRVMTPVLEDVTLDGAPAAYSTGIFDDVLYVGLDATPIPAGSTVTVAYRATVPTGLRDLTDLPNNAYVTSYTSLAGGGATYDGPSADATVTALSPVLEATKTIEGGTHPVAGDVVHYRLDVTNTGHAAASTLMVSDVLSDGDMNPVAAGTVTWPDASQTTMGGSGVLGLWTIGPVPGTLLPGQTAIVRWDMRVAADATSGAKDDTATATSLDPGGAELQSPVSSASVLVTRPGLSVHKVLLTPANGHASLGTTASYGITVTNIGDTTLTAVPLADNYDASRLAFASAGLRADSTSLGTLGWADLLPAGVTLAPGSTTDTLTVSFIATGTGTAVNTATVSGATDVWGHVPSDASDRNEDLTITRPHVAVTKELSTGQERYVPRGRTVSYDITVTNDGDTPLVTLPLTDTYDASRLVPVSASPATDTAGTGSLGWADLLSGGPALAPGGHRVITVTFRAIASGSLVDTATVTGATDVWGAEAPDASAANAVATGTNPQVDVSKVLAPGQSRLVSVGETVSYAFRITNTGDTTLTTVPLSDAYQGSQMAFVSATPEGATSTEGLLSWADASAGAGLAPGETTTATATFRVLVAAAALDDTATVNGFDVFGMAVLPQGSSNGVAGSYAPGDLTLVKTADPASGSVVATGSLIRYTLTYLNSSPATVTAGVISDTLVPALIYVSGSTALNGVPVSDAGSWDAGSSTLSVALPPVGPGVLGTVTFTARVAPWDLSRRGILNSASWSDGDSLVATAAPTVHNVDPLDVVKTVRDVSGKGKVRTGDVLEWTIQVVNRGVVPATGVRITDDVPKGTTYVRGSIAGPGASASGAPHLVWNVGTIAVDGTVTVTFRSKVGSVKNGTRISNQAVAYADQSGPKRSSSSAGAVDDPTTVVVRTAGDELWTLLFVLLLLAFALGLALPRPKAAVRRRVLRSTAAMLVLAALLSGGLEIAAANGIDVPTAGGVIASLLAPAASRVSVKPVSAKAVAVVNRVTIPSIHLNAKLVEGKDMGALARGLWHQPPSVAPGERGATVVAGHRIAGEFINLHLVRTGDRVTLTYGGSAHAYRVVSVRDVASTSATVSFRVGSVEKLILYTCTPRWQGNRRIVVTCLPVK